MVDTGQGCKESWVWQVNQRAKNGSRARARASAIVLRGALETHARPATCACVGCGGPRTRGRALQCKDVGKRRASKQAQCVHNIVRRSRVSRVKECSAGATMLLCACAGRERTFCGSVMLRKILLRFLPICVWKKDVGQHDGELAGACGLLRAKDRVDGAHDAVVDHLRRQARAAGRKATRAPRRERVAAMAAAK